jgi:hypothetical protein
VNNSSKKVLTKAGKIERKEKDDKINEGARENASFQLMLNFIPRILIN